MRNICVKIDTVKVFIKKESFNMGEYVKSKNDMNFASIDSLKSIQSVIDDADRALNDKSRRISDSPLSEVLTGAGALGAGLGAGVDLKSWYFLPGPLLTGPLLPGPSFIIQSYLKNKKLREAKELAYKNAVAKQTDIIKALKEEMDADKERIEYLQRLNIMLRSAIKDLEHDLG